VNAENIGKTMSSRKYALLLSLTIIERAEVPAFKRVVDWLLKRPHMFRFK
jgi:hypothetical protein